MKKMAFSLAGVVVLAACGAEENNENENSNEMNNEAEQADEENNEDQENNVNNVDEEEESNQNDENNHNDQDENNEAADGEETGEFPITVTDDGGNEVTIDEEPESIVTLQPSDTEILFALGAGDRLVGVDEFSDYPEEAMDIETVGAQDMDVERILQLEPDMALVSQYHHDSHSDVLDQYRDAGIDVVVIQNAESFDGVYDTIDMLGSVTGSEEEAGDIIQDMQETMEELAAQAEDIPEEDRRRVWVEVGPSPEIFTTGQGTFMHEIIETIGAENAAEDMEGWVEMTEEEIVSLQPDTIITTYGDFVEDPVEEVTSRDGWDDVPAVADEEIHDVDSNKVTRSGPRLAEGAEIIAEAVYPDVFQ
ncbi:ABC transporter substrate-binding protein [Alkalicoccus chagannorensis]|uniref:ABC transporter substrate-binding protein n=1 Tax=Alkalicoccus chagannorensis TaxID=427072 RepID=UPI0003FABF1B|nr:ABC transporter substrate-binding protein [Alkalicoccus chagannorensis]